MPDYQFIDRQHQLDLAATSLKDADCIAIDTESSGYYTYFSELCLIQVSSGGRHYIIDTLAGLDLAPLGPLCADAGITKIFHAAAADVGELRRHLGFEFQNVFDTMLACRMLGHESCSLLSLVKLYKGVELEKKEQKSNWKKRPLTRSQLDYAHLDTVYLEDLMQTMQKELGDLGLAEELREEVDRVVSLAGVDQEERVYDQDAWIRVRGSLDLPPEERGLLKELHAIRDRRARKENIAAFRLISNAGLLRLLRNRPASVEDLSRLRVANPVFVKKEGRRLLDALAAGAPAIGDNDLPRPPEQDPAIRPILKRLKKWRGRVAEHRGMDPSLIISNKALYQLARECPASVDELASMELMTGWMLKNYGAYIIQVVQGKYNGELPAGLPRLPEERRAG